MRAIIVGAAVAAGLMGATAWAHGQVEYGAGGMWDHGMGWGGYFLGPLMMILMIAVVVVMVVLIVRWVGGTAQPAASAAPAGRTALDILKERYARGEIDSAEFDERRRTLGE